MNRSTLIAMIVLVLIGFILFTGAVSLACHPNDKNSVANVISSFAPASDAKLQGSRPDPFSWDPVIHQLMQWISKACPV